MISMAVEQMHAAVTVKKDAPASLAGALSRKDGRLIAAFLENLEPAARFAGDHEKDAFLRIGFLEGLPEIAWVGHGFAIHFGNDISRLEATAISRSCQNFKPLVFMHLSFDRRRIAGLSDHSLEGGATKTFKMRWISRNPGRRPGGFFFESAARFLFFTVQSIDLPAVTL